MLTKEDNKKLLNQQKGPSIKLESVLGIDRGNLNVYRITNLDLIFLRKDNGRIMSLVKTWEQLNNKSLDEYDKDHQKIILKFMRQTHGEVKLQELIDSILNSKQREPIIVTSTGTIVNGNRRYTAMSVQKNKTGSSEIGLDVVILPEDLTVRDIDLIEQKYQFDPALGPVDYDDIDKALKIRELDQRGYTIKSQVSDHDPKKTEAQKKALEKDYQNKVNILTIVVDRFLDLIGQPNEYNVVKDRAWEACLEIYRTYDHKQIKSKYITQEERTKLLVTDLTLLEGQINNENAGSLNIIFRERRKHYLSNDPELKAHTTQTFDEVEQLLQDKTSSPDILKTKKTHFAKKTRSLTKQLLVKEETSTNYENIIGQIQNFLPKMRDSHIPSDKTELKILHDELENIIIDLNEEKNNLWSLYKGN